MATPQEMDAAAEEAAQELNTLFYDENAAPHHVSAWWVKWFSKAGHKRLGRALIKQHTKFESEIEQANKEA